MLSSVGLCLEWHPASPYSLSVYCWLLLCCGRSAGIPWFAAREEGSTGGRREAKGGIKGGRGERLEDGTGEQG